MCQPERIISSRMGAALEARRGHCRRAFGQVKMVHPRPYGFRLRIPASVCTHAPDQQHHDVCPGAHECGHAGGHCGRQERLLSVRPDVPLSGRRPAAHECMRTGRRSSGLETHSG
eukprot:4542553-Pyramimonas_sp.AAC.1